MKKTPEQLYRKCTYVPISGCWLWDGFVNKKTGYGLSGSELAHRAMYSASFGQIPSGLFVLHLCDVRSCINPAHLRLGSAKDNSRDMVVKGRSQKGEFSSGAKLTANQVLAIRANRGRITQKKIAETHNVSVALIEKIMSRKLWSHI